MEWTHEDGRNMRKLCLLAFAPDNAASSQDKFIVAANKGLIKNKLKPNRDFQINNWDDLCKVDDVKKVF